MKPTSEAPESKPPGFAALGVDPRLCSTLATLGYEEPTPIQRAAIPPLLEGRDLRGQAATGTGKTAAFALPLLQRLERKRRARGQVAALVLVPTRELAIQVAEAVHRYGQKLGASVLPIYGGQSIGQQLRVLERGVDVVVATPGRALDHLRRKTLDLSELRSVVLDEADEMLDMGFAEDIEAILAAMPAERQTALFSATMPPRILAIAKHHMRDPVLLNLTAERGPPGPGALPRVRQTAYIVSRGQKLAALARILDMETPAATIVFCRTRIEVDELTEKLSGHGYASAAIHGGLTQEQRDRVMGRFRSGKTEILVATDVAARGLDIEHVSHVVNYDVPPAPEAYVHRIGRTARAGREGVAITLAEPREHGYIRAIEKLTRQKINVAAVPTVADLRERRLEITKDALREAIGAGGLERFRAVVASLAEDADVMDIAAAALKLAHQATGGDEEGAADLVPPPPPGTRPVRPQGTRMAKLRISAGRRAGIRPGDLVGAISNEARVPSSMIGAIEIADHFSLVEIVEDVADSVVAALGRARLKGKPVRARREGGA